MAPSTRSQSSLAPPTRSSATPSSELAASSSSSGGPQTRARSRQRTSDESDKTVVPAGPSRRASPDGGVDYDDLPSSEFAASLASYTPPHSEPARDLAERAVVQSLLATWCNWAVESDADPERRFLRTASHFAREYEGAYRNRCQPPTPSYFAGVLLEWASQNTPQQYYYFGHGKQSSLAVQKVFLSRSFAGGATGGFVSPIDELAIDLRSLQLPTLLTTENLRTHTEIFGHIAQLVDGDRAQTASVSTPSSWSTFREDIDEPEGPQVDKRYIFGDKVSAEDDRNLRDESRRFATGNALLGPVDRAHVVPKRPSLRPLDYSVKMLAIESTDAFPKDWHINSAQNIFLLDKNLHSQFDDETVCWVPPMPVLRMCLEFITTPGQTGCLDDALDGLLEPFDRSNLPYDMVALDPRKASAYSLVVYNSRPDRPGEFSKRIYDAGDDGAYYDFNQPDMRLPARVFTRRSVQVSLIGMIFNVALKARPSAVGTASASPSASPPVSASPISTLTPRLFVSLLISPSPCAFVAHLFPLLCSILHDPALRSQHLDVHSDVALIAHGLSLFAPHERTQHPS